MSAMNQQQARVQVGVPEGEAGHGPDPKGFSDNPLYDTEKMGTAVVMANQVTRSCTRSVLALCCCSRAVP